MDPKLLEVRLRLRDDFRYYSANCMKIRTKEGTIKPLIFNPAQDDLDAAIRSQEEADGKVRVIILKARQQGLSTAVGAYLYHKVSQHEAQKAMVVAHKADSTNALFSMTKRYHENAPAAVKPHTRYSTKRELTFDVLDSSFTVATAGGEGIARGETVNHLHASELAFWNPQTAKENWNGLTQAVPNARGTSIFIESTANGVSGLFYDLWQGAVNGENGYIPVFIPWFRDPDYRDDAPATFTHTPEEETLVVEYGLDKDQLQWRRRKIAENGLDLFRQEYPSYPEEAFLTTGRPVFNPEQTVEALKHTIDPIARWALEQSGETTYTWRPHPLGELRMFLAHDDNETYYIGADISMGVRGGDWSVAQVFDSKKRQVAMYRAQVHPDYFARILYELGMYYNTARIIPENNNHGILTCHLLSKELYYPDLYSQIQHDKINDKETVVIGFTTNVKTKPMVIDELRAALREGEITLYDEVTLKEMKTYIVTETGKMEAEAGCHDDCVISLALVNYVHDGELIPIKNEDYYYQEGI
jgi:hypothetical protein